MQILATAVQFENHPRPCPFANLAAEGHDQCLDIGEHDTATGRHRINGLKRSTVFGFHAISL